MLAPLTFPDVQQLITSYLRPRITPVPVGVVVPSPRPATFVTVRRAGGTADGLFDHPRLDLFAWAGSDPDAHDLTQRLRRALAGLPAADPRCVAVAEFAGPIPAPDPSNQPRWLVTYEFTLRGTV